MFRVYGISAFFSVQSGAKFASTIFGMALFPAALQAVHFFMAYIP